MPLGKKKLSESPNHLGCEERGVMVPNVGIGMESETSHSLKPVGLLLDHVKG